jgi:hypothetical protein
MTEMSSAVPFVPGGRLLAGHALQFGRDPLALFQRARGHGDVVRIRFGPVPVYVLNSPAFHRTEIARYTQTMRERLLRILLSELVTQQVSANVPGLSWVPTRSNRRFSAARRRLEVLLTDVIAGYRAAGADRGDLISMLMRARDDDTGAGYETLGGLPFARAVITSTLVPSELPVTVTRRR